MFGLRERLKAETAELHDRLNALPFFRALQTGDLPKLAVVSFLRSLVVIHAVIERSLAQVSCRQIAELTKQAPPKVPLLVADLDIVGAANLPGVRAAMHHTLDFAAEILATAESPPNLIGTLYVVEGSQNGGFALKRAYARSLGVPEGRLSYIGCYGSGTAAHWEAFAELLRTLPLDDEQAAQVVGSAMRAFERLADICAALYPYSDKDLDYQAAAINYEAGDHAVPQNPLEIDLALRAGRAAWLKYSYLDLRFGERGRRFTGSDSCWLVALTRMPQETATKNLHWLRAVLASRGIPTVILENHLGVIQEALAAEFPREVEMRQRFDQFLSSVRAERRMAGGAEALTRLTETFDRRLRACAGKIVESAAELIVSAWLDERAGIAGALAAVRDWFTETGRFSSDWIAAVDELVSKLDQAGGLSC